MPLLRDNEELISEPQGSSLRYTVTLDFGPFVRAMAEAGRKINRAFAWLRFQKELRDAMARAQILSLPAGPEPYWLSRYDGETGRRAIEGISNPLPIGGTDALPWPRYRPDTPEAIAAALAAGEYPYE
jgi:hypothetical protein